MAPAFSSTREAAAFALLLLTILLLPLLVGKANLPPREQMYASLGWRIGNYPYLQQQIFHEKGDIDIAFIGSSEIGTDIDTPYVQKKLSEKLGRQATVISLCWKGPGFDLFYFIAKDLLQNRRVHMLVFYDDHGDPFPHTLAWHLVRFGDNASDMADLPIRFKIIYYYGAIIGMPRNLLSKLRPNLPVNLSPEKVEALKEKQTGLPTEILGAWYIREGYNYSIPSFAPYAPSTDAQTSDVYTYSTATAAKFDFSGPPPPPFQIYFASKFIALARSYQTRLVCLNMPHVTDQRTDTIPEGPLPQFAQNSGTALVGIPPARLFGNLSNDDVIKMFEDWHHFNRNGQQYFTPLVTPSLIQLYEQTEP